MYIIRVVDKYDGEVLDYEYSNINHASEHYELEDHAQLVEYNFNNKEYSVLKFK